MTTLDDIREYSPFTLAGMADCYGPDRVDSPGSVMLVGVRDDLVEAIESGTVTLHDLDDRGQLHEIADGAPSIYTHTRWAQFADLGAYQEEPETGEWPDDLTSAAGIALYQIADRLVRLLADEWRDGWQCPTCGDTFDEGTCDQDGCNNPAGAMLALMAEREADRARLASIEADRVRVEAETDSDMRRMDAIRTWHESDVRSARVLAWSAATVLAVIAVTVILAVM